MPGESQRINYTMSIMIDGLIPAGENTLWIGGRWHYEPGMGGGSISEAGIPLHIAPVTSAGFTETFAEFYIGPNDSDFIDVEIINNGNVLDPEMELQLLGLEETSESDLYIDYTLDVSSDFCSIRVFTGDVRPEDEWDIVVNMIDVKNESILDSFEFTIIIMESSIPGDDDEPPVGDDDDEPPTELLSFDECRRSYTDDLDDEVYYSVTMSDVNFKIGENPKVDAKKVDVYRENDELVIKIEARGQARGWSYPYVFILPDDSMKQGGIYQDDIMSARLIEYEPPYVVASNDIFAKGDYWISEVVREGNFFEVRGEMAFLMESGMDENFEVFVKLVDADPTFLWEENIEDMEIEVVIDFARFGAGEVYDEEKPKPREPTSIGDVLKYAGIALIVIVLILVVLLVIYFGFIRKKRKRVLE
jgi:hypothetical protein